MLSFLKDNILPICLVALALGLFGLGTYEFLQKEEEPVDFVDSQPTNAPEIVVDVEGAVLKAGIYKLSPEARMQDAIKAAGGLDEDADKEWVEKNVSLASRLSDGLKIYIPREGEEIGEGSSTVSAERISR